MELKLVRGIVADLIPADKSGCVVCHVGERSVRLHRDFSNALKAGDDVLVGGELHKDVVQGYALKNFTRPKLFKVDFTFYILGAGLGGFLVSIGLYVSGQVALGSQAIALGLLSVGLGLVFISIRRVLRNNKLAGWVDSVKE